MPQPGGTKDAMPASPVYDPFAYVPEEGTCRECGEWAFNLFLSDSYLPDRVRITFSVAGFEVVSVEHCHDYRLWFVRLKRGRSVLRGCQKAVEAKVWAVLALHGLEADKDIVLVRRDGDDYAVSFKLE